MVFLKYAVHSLVVLVIEIGQVTMLALRVRTDVREVATAEVLGRHVNIHFPHVNFTSRKQLTNAPKGEVENES
jgi:hypothetical protein